MHSIRLISGGRFLSAPLVWQETNMSSKAGCCHAGRVPSIQPSECTGRWAKASGSTCGGQVRFRVISGWEESGSRSGSEPGSELGAGRGSGLGLQLQQCLRWRVPVVTVIIQLLRRVERHEGVADGCCMGRYFAVGQGPAQQAAPG